MATSTLHAVMARKYGLLVECNSCVFRFLQIIHKKYPTSHDAKDYYFTCKKNSDYTIEITMWMSTNKAFGNKQTSKQ